MKFNLSFRIKQNQNPVPVILKAMYLFLLISFFLPMIAFGRDYHVSASATGSGKGIDTENFCILSYANDNILPGETAYLYDDRGVIAERINPNRNGSSDAQITYMAANGEAPVLSPPDRIDADDMRSAIAFIGKKDSEKQYVKVQGVTVRSINSKTQQRFFNIKWSNHITFEDCTFETPPFTGGITISDMNYNMSLVMDSKYIRFISCSWDASTTPINSDSQHDLLHLERISHSLWKDCEFGDVSHTAMRYDNGHTSDEYVALIDCIWTNRWRRGYAIIPDDWKIRPKRWLIQGNIHADVGWDNKNCPWFKDRDRYTDQKIDGINFIVRENISYGCDTGYTAHSHRQTQGNNSNNYIYHNTFYSTVIPEENTRGGLGWWGGQQFAGYRDNVIINNIFWDYDGKYSRSRPDEFQVFVSTSPDSPIPVGNDVSFNSFGRYKDSVLETYIRWNTSFGSLTRIESLESQWHDNVLADPGFTDPDNLFFTPANLTPTNPQVLDSARHLTLTNGSGTNHNVLTVDDAAYFFSGPNAPWFLVGTKPDTIYIEDAGAVEISSIDYSANRIILSKDMTWQNNKKVYHRPYSGSGPDIGAIEKGGPSATQVRIKKYEK